ncbi:response regulator transcription factor [Dyadobacter sp. LHD-138]|uniref:response regulator transcription factor n=1 Tax=Dyadobacter sp. LHD-138 TaxID=3071413 RepID=UPI0027DFD500|nr:response regulator transcription factor [Dyadobacter sp. LHD-138]MDQ6480546.1 response regulator transcription factor [Dyadobacter sp. LHD-138]
MITALIDRNIILRTGLHTILSRNFPDMLILDAESVESFGREHRDLQPDLVVFAQQMEIDITSEIVQLKNFCKPGAIMVYNIVFDVKVIREYFKNGVIGCISRRISEPELVKCVTEVLDGRRYIGQDFQELILEGALTNPWAPKTEGRPLLSPREKQIAVYLSNGYKTTWIANELKKKPSTISTIKMNIFRKLSIDNVVALRQIITTA